MSAHGRIETTRGNRESGVRLVQLPGADWEAVGSRDGDEQA